MDREEIRDRILLALNEDITSPVAFSLANINTIIDEASEVMAEEIAELQKTAYVPMGPGQMFYTTHAIGSDVMTPYRLWLVDDEKRLEFITIRQMEGAHIRWMETQTTASSFPDWWFPVSWDAFGLWPGQSAAAGTLRVDYLAWPDALLDDGDSPPWSDSAHDALVTYGIYDGLMQQWEFTKALDIFNEFVALVVDRSFRDLTSRFQKRVMFRLESGLSSPVDRIQYFG